MPSSRFFRIRSGPSRTLVLEQGVLLSRRFLRAGSPFGGRMMNFVKDAQFPKGVMLFVGSSTFAKWFRPTGFQELSAEPGVLVDHATLNRRVTRYSPLIAATAHRWKAAPGPSWRSDAICVKVKAGGASSSYHPCSGSSPSLRLRQPFRESRSQTWTGKGQMAPGPVPLPGLRHGPGSRGYTNTSLAQLCSLRENLRQDVSALIRRSSSSWTAHPGPIHRS